MKENTGRFKKGQVPWNKGLKTGPASGDHMFQKGAIPWNKGKAHKTITGDRHYKYKGGFWINDSGYKIIEVKRLGKRFRVREHRMVMEAHLGRKLAPNEDVHHIDHDKLNNSIDNLMVLSKREHTLLHHREGKVIPHTLR